MKCSRAIRHKLYLQNFGLPSSRKKIYFDFLNHPSKFSRRSWEMFEKSMIFNFCLQFNFKIRGWQSSLVLSWQQILQWWKDCKLRENLIREIITQQYRVSPFFTIFPYFPPLSPQFPSFFTIHNNFSPFPLLFSFVKVERALVLTQGNVNILY